MNMPGHRSLKIKIFLDGAEVDSMRAALTAMPFVRGFTTNPTLMRKAGVSDYAAFAQEAIAAVGGLPISFEVFSDEFDEMERQARTIRGWGGNTFIKVPITNTRGDSSIPLIERLSAEGIPVNVTALLTLEQVRAVARVLAPATPAIVSVFAGRIADTGIDPVPVMTEAVALLADRPKAELLWASPREVLNVVQADSCGCGIITATKDILAKLPLLGRDLTAYSLETVRMFYDDAKAAGYELAELIPG